MSLALALVIAACGGGDDSTADADPATTESSSALLDRAGNPDPGLGTTSATQPVDSDSQPAMTPAPDWPQDRIHPTLSPDPVSGQMLMIGGLSRMGPVMDMRDAWLLDTRDVAWTHLADGTPDSAFNFGIDTDSAQLVAYNLSPAETWSYDLTTGAWTRRMPDIQPETTSENPRFGTPLTYDAESDRIVLFGGGSPWHMYSDTWAYDADTTTWELMAPESSPSPRAMYATAYDSESDRVLLWGGFTGTDENDVQMWAYDYNTDSWEALPNREGPQQHPERHGMAYIPDLDRTLVYSGMLEHEGVLPAETWLYDYNTNTWTEVEVETSPPALAMYGMAYDPETGNVVLYGGEMTSKTAGNLSPDIWVFDPATVNWTRIQAPGPSGID
jgi:hypothetical protein